MGIINVNSPGKRRSQARRTIAEALRHLYSKRNPDAEAKDLAALIVFSLREIEQGVEESAAAWEKRDYFRKADQLRTEWAWAGKTAAALSKVLSAGWWEDLPDLLAHLLPHFQDVTVNKLTRSPELWQGCYARLLQDEASKAQVSKSQLP
jgi:hypothetical protein